MGFTGHMGAHHHCNEEQQKSLLIAVFYQWETPPNQLKVCHFKLKQCLNPDFSLYFDGHTRGSPQAEGTPAWEWNPYRWVHDKDLWYGDDWGCRKTGHFSFWDTHRLIYNSLLCNLHFVEGDNHLSF